MADIPLNVVIYMAFKPLLKVYLSAGLGFISVKQGILTAEGTSVISQMILNFLLPCLVFSNVVTNIKVSDAQSFGILILTCALYLSLGAVFAGIVRLTLPVPKAWIGGLFFATMLNNSGDLPIAYIQTLGKSKYFPSDSTSLGTAYCVLYNLGFNLFIFNFGGAKLLSLDGSVPGPDKFEPTVPPLSFEKVKHTLGKSGKNRRNSSSTDLPTSKKDTLSPQQTHEPPVGIYRPESLSMDRTSIIGDAHSIDDIQANTDCGTLRPRFNSMSSQTRPRSLRESPRVLGRFRQKTLVGWRKFKGSNSLCNFIATFVENLFRIQALSIMISILVAFVPWLRRLFVVDANVHGIHDAPDGRPPLDFIMDFATFMGQCQVPLGLFLLGGTIARLKISTLPKGFWKIMVALAVFKLCALPIFAIFWASRLRDLGWYTDDMPMFPVTMIACASTPSATSQIYLTLLYTLNSADAQQQLNCFGATIIFNYALLPLTMTTGMSYTVKNIV